jgi:hypothetical protein
MSCGPKRIFEGRPTASFSRWHRPTSALPVTCDPDFGELAFHFGLPASCGVVLLRIPWTDPIADNAFAVAMITSRDDWTGVFAVVERDRIRIRPLPTPAPND